MLKCLQAIIFFLFIGLQSYANGTKGSKLMLILLDGFKWNYFDRVGIDLPGFRKIFREGVRADYMVSDMPTLSFPNIYSIMTGLHCESHGMVGNSMYDVKHNETFLARTLYHSFWWDDAEPIWISAVRQGKRAYMYQWIGCDVMIRGHNSTFCNLYKGIPTVSDLRQNVEDAIKNLKMDNADLVGIYVQLIDRIGHAYGPNSVQINDILSKIDTEIERLLNLLQTQNLKDDVNVMIFSDHGMTEVSPSRVINITNHIDMSDIDELLDKGPTVNIWPKTGKIEKVYQDLKSMNNTHMAVYKKDQIPDKWFLKQHYRVPPILLVAEIGWFILTPYQLNFQKYEDSGTLKGYHGYDNTEPDMRAIFAAVGPDFRSNFRSKPFTNVNLYQIMSKLLNISPSPHNGTWSEVKDMLIDDVSSSNVTSASFIVLCFCFILSRCINKYSV